MDRLDRFRNNVGDECAGWPGVAATVTVAILVLLTIAAAVGVFAFLFQWSLVAGLAGVAFTVAAVAWLGSC